MGEPLPFQEAGSGPAVILLHAGITDHGMWSAQIEPLADAGLRVIAPDLPGFGNAPGRQLDEPWIAVLDTMDAAEIATAALVGCSFGGAVAQRIAVLAPERVSALGLISAPAPGMDPSPQLLAAFEAEESAMEAGDIDGAVQAVLDAWLLPGHPRSCGS